jgi:prophage DNA circulation protein
MLRPMTPTVTTSRTFSRRCIGVALGVALTAAIAAAALAQQPSPAPDRAARQQELDALQAVQRKAADVETLLRGEIAALGEDRRKLTEALLSTAGRLRLA